MRLTDVSTPTSRGWLGSRCAPIPARGAGTGHRPPLRVWRFALRTVTLVAIGVPTLAAAQNVQIGDCVRVAGAHVDGVPLHREARNSFTGKRVPNQSLVRVDELADAGRWLRIAWNDEPLWMSRSYVVRVEPCGSPAPTTQPAAASGGAYLIGTWNLEHFSDTSNRGFPENTKGGPSFGPRTDDDYRFIAKVITDLDIKILLMQEIGGRDEDGVARSREVERLIAALGSDYDYRIASSGGKQRIAILFDRRAARLNRWCELELENTKVQGKGLFERQPLVAHFTLLEGGQPRNDLAVVGVHLAAGQHLTQNHDQAMTRLRAEIDELRASAECIPDDENDVLIAGDFNANRFDNKRESFWADYESSGWDVLGDDAAAYPPTRLSGNPLALRTSKIDYIIVTAGPRGLSGEEIEPDRVTIHEELVGQDAVEFRRRASDHIPVTVRVRVMDDTDVSMN